MPETGDAGAGLALMLTGAFCALWAQNSGRSPWVWFLAGIFLHVFTLVALLAKNAADIREGGV